MFFSLVDLYYTMADNVYPHACPHIYTVPKWRPLSARETGQTLHASCCSWPIDVRMLILSS